MERSMLAIYIREVEFQCVAGTHALDDLIDAIGYHDLVRIWSNVQTILVAQANLSKLFWPDSRGNSERGAILRECLHISDDTILASRTLRNDLEHFDERLDKWAKSHANDKNASLLVRFISAGQLPFEGIAPEDYFLYVDVATMSVRFGGHACNLWVMRDAMQELEERAVELLFPFSYAAIDSSK